MTRIQYRRILFCAALLAAAGCSREPASAPAAATPPGHAAAPASIEWNAMGTRVRLLVRGDGAAEAAAAMSVAASNALEAVEAQTSAFRAEGPLARLRETAGSGEWIAVGEPFEAALDLALETARASGGAFNPLVAPLLEAHGFARRPPGAPPPEAGSPPPETLLDLAAIERRPGACRLVVRGMALDFGGLAKGLGADCAAAAAREAAPNDFLLDAGGTLAGRGTWTIGLRDPRGAPDAPPLRALALPEGTACATSGNYERFVENPDGSLVGHLFDPRTALPARSGILQTTAFAPTAAEADAWSTALFVLGPDAGREALAARPGISAVWVLSAPGGGISLVPGGGGAARFDSPAGTLWPRTSLPWPMSGTACEAPGCPAPPNFSRGKAFQMIPVRSMYTVAEK